MIIRRPPESTRRLGIDLGGRRVAWSTFVDKELVEIDHFEMKASGNRAQELHACSSQLAEAIYLADEVYIEEPFIGRGVRASMTLVQMLGAVLKTAALVKPTLNPVVVPVDTWKQEVCGKGGLSKEQVSEWLKEHHSEWFEQCLYERPKAGLTINQDRVDAICIGLYAVA